MLCPWLGGRSEVDHGQRPIASAGKPSAWARVGIGVGVRVRARLRGLRAIRLGFLRAVVTARGQVKSAPGRSHAKPRHAKPSQAKPSQL